MGKGIAWAMMWLGVSVCIAILGSYGIVTTRLGFMVWDYYKGIPLPPKEDVQPWVIGIMVIIFVAMILGGMAYQARKR